MEAGEVKGDHLFKIVFLGDANTGKVRCLAHTFCLAHSAHFQSSIILRSTDNVFTGSVRNV